MTHSPSSAQSVACDRYQVLNEAGEALLAAGHSEAYEVVYRMMKAARAAASAQATPDDDCKCRRLGDWEGVHHPLCDSAALTAENVAGPKLSVMYGPMPESNGKTNWTAILHNGDIASGITLDRSEYPDRVRYEADRARWLIGELDKEPFILDYDADKHSGYVAPQQPAQPVAQTLALTDEQVIAIEAAISISADIEAESHDGSFLSSESVEALRALLAAQPASSLAEGGARADQA